MSLVESDILVDVEQHDGVRRIRLSRPEKRNAISTAMLLQLQAALDGDRTEEEARVVILTGKGSAFSAGADISEYEAMDAEELRIFTDRAAALCTRLATLPVPVIAAVNGAALGGGFELVLCCDLVVAASSATFGLPELRLGLIPGWGGTQRLAHHVGPNRARELILLGKRLTADDAAKLGIVNRMCDPGELPDIVGDLAGGLARQPILAVAAARHAIRCASPAQQPGAAGFAVERGELGELFGSADAREGIDAFLYKREPGFGTTSLRS